MKNKLQFPLLIIVVLCFTSLANADSFVTYGSRAAQNPTDFIDWNQLGPDFLFTFTTIPTPALVSTFNGSAAMVGNINGGDFVRVDEGLGWGGNFDYGESLVWTGNPNFGLGGGGPFALVFRNGVTSVGFGIQADLYGPFTATVELFDVHGNPLSGGTFGFVGDSFFSEAGDNLFIGIGDLSGNNIGAVLISTDSGDPNFVNDFLIDDPSFTTPEPSSLVLLGSGLLGIAGLIRRKFSV